MASSYALPPPAAPATRRDVAVLLVGTALIQTFHPEFRDSPYLHLSFLKCLLLFVTAGSRLQRLSINRSRKCHLFCLKTASFSFSQVTPVPILWDLIDNSSVYFSFLKERLNPLSPQLCPFETESLHSFLVVCSLLLVPSLRPL